LRARQFDGPYGVRDIPEEYRDFRGKNWFARAPGSDIWVAFDDLPDEICKALQRRPAMDDPFAVTPPVDDFDELAQNLLRMVRKFPNEFSDLDGWLDALDRMADEVADETVKLRWRNRCSKLEQLVEVVKRKVEGRKHDS
jgi:hypothetical protein